MTSAKKIGFFYPLPFLVTVTITQPPFLSSGFGEPSLVQTSFKCRPLRLLAGQFINVSEVKKYDTERAFKIRN